MYINKTVIHILLPGQQCLLHLMERFFKPIQSLPPQVDEGLLHFLVNFCVPPPQDLVHFPYVHELHSPLTTTNIVIKN